jgi:hypothetical protein
MAFLPAQSKGREFLNRKQISRTGVRRRVIKTYRVNRIIVSILEDTNYTISYLK